jgi:hypothetical protein
LAAAESWASTAGGVLPARVSESHERGRPRTHGGNSVDLAREEPPEEQEQGWGVGWYAGGARKAWTPVAAPKWGLRRGIRARPLLVQ